LDHKEVRTKLIKRCYKFIAKCVGGYWQKIITGEFDWWVYMVLEMEEWKKENNKNEGDDGNTHVLIEFEYEIRSNEI